jgi:hypothetical protein
MAIYVTKISTVPGVIISAIMAALVTMFASSSEWWQFFSNITDFPCMWETDKRFSQPARQKKELHAFL